MPVSTTDFILSPAATSLQVALEPAHNAIESMLLLNLAETRSGYDEWVTRTANTLPDDILQRNKVVTLGLHYAITPSRSWSSFPAFVDHLAAADPEHLRSKIFDVYTSMPCNKALDKDGVDLGQVLNSVGAFLDFLYARFDAKYVNVAIESEAYHLLKEPALMQETIVSHFRWMWENVLKTEWEARLPLLQASVDAFNQIDMSELTAVAAAQTITGNELPESIEKMLTQQEYERVIFVPSAHVGPYLGKISGNNTFWILFGARQPEGLLNYPDLSRSELLVRLSALADDTRLRILHLLSTEGEFCAQDIIQQLDLSQSAASRHLKQLSANGFIHERRRKSGKCYIINTDRVETTFRALLNFLNA